MSYELLDKIMSTPLLVKQVEFGQALTTREGEILVYLGQCYMFKEIAQLLNISPKTVERHVHTLYPKIGVRSVTELVHYAIKNNHVKAGDVRPIKLG